MPAWTQDDIASLNEMKQNGASNKEIAAVLGKTEASVRSFKNRNPETSSVSVTPEWEDCKDVGEWWGRAEELNSRKIDKANKQSNFTAVVNDELPIAITLIADQHIAVDNCVDMKRMREDAELVASTPGLYAILGGDGVDNHIKHAAAILAARSTPDDQYTLFEHYLGMFNKNILAVISGNHCAWTHSQAGIDMISRLAKQKKIAYSPAEARIKLIAGHQEYRVLVRHQYRFGSNLNQTHTVKQLYRMGDWQFDIGCICHHHEPAVETCIMHGLKRVFCRPGSYQISSAYSKQYGFCNTHPTCPTIILYPDQREMMAFDDVRQAARFLVVERRRYEQDSKKMGEKSPGNYRRNKKTDIREGKPNRKSERRNSTGKNNSRSKAKRGKY